MACCPNEEFYENENLEESPTAESESTTAYR